MCGHSPWTSMCEWHGRCSRMRDGIFCVIELNVFRSMMMVYVDFNDVRF